MNLLTQPKSKKKRKGKLKRQSKPTPLKRLKNHRRPWKRPRKKLRISQLLQSMINSRLKKGKISN